MTRYDAAPTQIVEQVETLMTDAFPSLVGAGVTIGVYMATGWIADDAESIAKPALMQRKRQVLAMPRVTKHHERAAGLADVMLYLDGDVWNDVPERRQEATLFELLASFELVLDKEGAVKEDPGGRPRLRLRVPDLYVEGHSATVEKYGADAPGAVALVQCQQMLQPMFAEWG